MEHEQTRQKCQLTFPWERQKVSKKYFAEVNETECLMVIKGMAVPRLRRVRGIRSVGAGNRLQIKWGVGSLRSEGEAMWLSEEEQSKEHEQQVQRSCGRSGPGVSKEQRARGGAEVRDEIGAGSDVGFLEWEWGAGEGSSRETWPHWGYKWISLIFRGEWPAGDKGGSREIYGQPLGLSR